MKRTSSTLLIFTLSLISRASSQDYGGFRGCLTERGFPDDRVVPRGYDNKYVDINYQFREKPPPVYPLVYVLPVSEQEVSSVIQCARRSRMHVTARSGGHQYEKYAYGNENSIVIDLAQLSYVTVNPGHTATIGSGTILGRVAWRLWADGGVFFPMGLCPMVGIGGLAPGGGHGYFTRNFGLTLDYIQEMTVVNAAGAVLTVNSSSHSDLYWALRGGGAASFGIVTKFVFRTIKPPAQIFEGVLYYNLDSCFSRVFDAWQRFFSTSPRQITPNFRLRNRAIEIHFFDSAGTPDMFHRIERAFPKPRNKTVATYSYPDFLFYTATNFGGSLKDGYFIRKPSDLSWIPRGVSRREDIKTKSFFVPKRLNNQEISQLHALFRQQPASVRSRFEGYGGAVNDVSETATAFVHRQQNCYNFRATVDYNLIRDDTERATADRWLQRFYEFGINTFQSKETYQNYPDAQIKDYLQRYYGRNLQRLTEVKRKYDPNNYFRNPQSIPTHMPRVAGEENTAEDAE